MQPTHRAPYLWAALFALVCSASCTTTNHPPERIWPAATPGAYAGTTAGTERGAWWFPSEIGPMEVPPEGGNKGTIYYAGPGGVGPTASVVHEVVAVAPTAPASAPAPAPAPAPEGVVQRIVYDRVFVEQEIRAERLIFPAITFAPNSADVDAEAQNQLRQAAAAIVRARGYNVTVEGHMDAGERAGVDGERARVARAALRDLGVDGERLSVQTMGTSAPLSSEDTPIGHRLNRRVAFEMVPSHLELNPQGPADEPMPMVEPGTRVETVRRTVTVTVPRLVFVDRLVFPNILFDYDKSDLRPESILRADAAAEAVRALERTRQLTVVGHCDHIGSHEYNDALSLRRANAVRDRLVATGLSPERIAADGRGKRQPIANNDTPEGRQLNRRVEFHVEYAE